MMRCALLLVPALLLAAPVQAANICLQPGNIVSSTSPDGKTLVITMRDGTVWHNRLRDACPGLKFGGFSWIIHDPVGICENMQTLRVLQTGAVCMLGKFVKQPAKAKPANQNVPAKPGAGR